MGLPDIIEIQPLKGPVSAEITVPGSKSITNRALILAALADGETTLRGALWSEDTQIMVECLQELGFMIVIAPEPDEICNRTITVYGKSGQVPRGGTAQHPSELFVGNAGTAARFLAAFVCLGEGAYRLSGVPRMHERPQAALFEALRQLGYTIDSANNRLPAVFHGRGPLPGKCRVSIEESSQFASGLLLCSRVGRWQVEVTGENAEESPYASMTSKMLEVFPRNGGEFQIEPDASSGSYFLAASPLEPHKWKEGSTTGYTLDLSVMVRNWPPSGWQIDSQFLPRLAALEALAGSGPISDSQVGQGWWPGCQARANDTQESNPPGFWSKQVPVEKCWRPDWQERAKDVQKGYPPSPGTRQLRVQISRKTELGDSIMTLIVLAPLLKFPVHFTDLGRLRVQECERVAALRTELTRCGAKVEESGDTLIVSPSSLHGAEIETYNDHRIAMSFAILGLKIPGIKIKNPSCVKKTFPNFFQKLAAPPPHGLGATILDGASGQRLGEDSLFAD